MTRIILLLLYIQFVIEFFLQQPRNPYITYIITVMIFIYIIFECLWSIKIDKTILAYIICIILLLINESYIASANIIGYYFCIKKSKNISIKSFGLFFMLLNSAVFFLCAGLIMADNSLIRIWGEKLDKNIVLYGFNNPNTQAEYLYFCILGFWFFSKNKVFRCVIVLLLTILAYELARGRTYMLASAVLLLSDIMITKRTSKFYLKILIITPILIFILSFCIGLVTRNSDFTFFDVGLYGRFFVFGYVLKNMDIFRFIFGASASNFEGVPLDVSVFAIFATRGIIMFLFLLAQYIKYVKKIDRSNIKYIPAIISLMIAGVALPSLAWFSVNMVLLMLLLEYSRRIHYERHNNYCTNI